MKLKKQLSTILAGVIMTTLMVTGCSNSTTQSGSNSETQQSQNTSSKSENTLTLAELWEIDSVDPVDDGTLTKEKALITESLVEVDQNFNLIPGLAKEWTQTGDLTWQFKLRDDVKFHDGTDLNAESVKWSLERAIKNNPSVDSLAKIEKIEAKDDSTLVFTTTQKNGDLPAVLHYANTSILSKSSVDSSGNFVEPIGTGPFKFESLDKSTGVLTVTRNEDYYGNKPALEKLVIRPITDPNTRALSIENGEVDFTCDPPLNDIDRISQLDGIKVEKYTTPRVYSAKYNLHKDYFKDVNVRKALSYALNRESIVDDVLHGVGDVAVGPFSDSMAWVNKDLKGYDYDVEKAKSLLEETGWKDTDNDGILDKDGEKFEISVLTYSERPGLPLIAQAMQGFYEDIGIKLEVKVMNNSAISETMESGDWDLYLFANATAMIPTPKHYFNSNYYSENCKVTGYSNKEMDDLINKCLSTSDQDKKYEYAKQIQQMAEDDEPIIQIAYYGVGFAMKDTVKNFKFNPTAHDYSLNTDITIEK